MKPTTITLEKLNHRNTEQIAIRFPYSKAVKDYIKQFDGVKWSQTHHTFYVKDSSKTLHKLFTYLRKKQFYVDYSALKSTSSPKDPMAKPHNKKQDFKRSKEMLYKSLPADLKDMLKRYVGLLKSKRLSQSTVSVYGFFVLRFMDFSKEIAVDNWNKSTVDLFMERVLAEENYSISSHRQCVSALKYLAEMGIATDLDPEMLKRPKKSRLLPVVLSKEEIIDLLQATKNLKHRAILALIYSSGLRIGELIDLELKDLDMDRSQVHIKMGKGRKDRTVVMAEIVKPLLHNYINTYQPKRYFAEGQKGGKYSAGSVRKFLRVSCKRASISKRVTPHTLRHSYATHMMENGVDLRHIQELLGHAKPETTMIYTHVAQKDLMQVKSPLDVTVTTLTKSGNKDKKVLLSRNFKG